MNIKKDLIEGLIFLVFVVLYVFSPKGISGKYYFIIPAIIFLMDKGQPFWDHSESFGFIQ
jgi:hypothetical protein